MEAGGKVVQGLGVIPAKAGIHLRAAGPAHEKRWIPAFAGMTAVGLAGLKANGRIAGRQMRGAA